MSRPCTSLERLAADAVREVWRAGGLHPPMNSTHEAYAVILERLDDFWEEVRGGGTATLRKELTQVAAMAIRAIHDLKL